METNSFGRRLDGQWIGRWDGLWVTCVRESRNPMSCQSYSQTILMSPDLKISRILMSFAILAAIGGCACSLIGMLLDKFCLTNKKNQRCFLLLGGVSFIMAGILVLIPAVFTAISTLRDICYSNCKNVQHQEIGEAIMLAWPTVMLFLIGGAIFSWYHPCVCSNKRCLCPSEEIHHGVCQEDNDLAQELQVFRQNRRQNHQDIVI
ncbi:claudin-8-like [Dendropsophus ebraccatus]|uniref:claudin-8-like n=1 Tax=Dendropsophus ebraccatus TaxID=150705 RepID=UPI003831E12D